MAEFQNPSLPNGQSQNGNPLWSSHNSWLIRITEFGSQIFPSGRKKKDLEKLCDTF